METNDDLRKERLEPRPDILDGPRIRRVIQMTSERWARSMMRSNQNLLVRKRHSESSSSPLNAGRAGKLTLECAGVRRSAPDRGTLWEYSRSDGKRGVANY
jgi:hypothetical protein